MSMVSKFRMIYLAAPLMLGLSSCSLIKHDVFLNGSSSLEYKVNTSAMSESISKNVQKRIDGVNKNYTKNYLDTQFMWQLYKIPSNYSDSVSIKQHDVRYDIDTNNMDKK